MSSSCLSEVLKELVDDLRELWDIAPVVVAGTTIEGVVPDGPAPVLEVGPPTGVQNESALLCASMDFEPTDSAVGAFARSVAQGMS